MKIIHTYSLKCKAEPSDIYIEAVEKFIAKKLKIAFVNAIEILTTIYLSKTVGAISKWKQIGINSAKVKDDVFNNVVINLSVSKVLLKARIERYRGSQNRSQR